MRARRIIRIVAGWIFVGLALVIMFSSSHTKTTTPVVDCGAPSIIVMFDQGAAEVAPPLQSECQDRSRNQVLGGLLLCALPGGVLLIWPRIRRRRAHDGRRSFSTDIARASRARWLGPRPVEVVFDTTLSVEQARSRLRTLGNGGPIGSLRVKEATDETMRATLVGDVPPRFVGRLSSAPSGAELRGFVRANSADGLRFAMFAGGAAASWIAAVIVWIGSTVEGHTDLGTFLLLGAMGAFLGLLAFGGRALSARTFPVVANRLVEALAHALECPAPSLPANPLAPRTVRRIFVGSIVVTAILFAVRVGVATNPLAAFGLLGVYLGVGYLAYRASRWWRPHLDGSVLRVGFRSLDLDAVHEVRARPAVMSLSNGTARVTLSSRFGRPTSADAARSLLASPPRDTPPDILDDARVTVAVGQVVERCLLDPRTAAALQRTATGGEVVGRAPFIDPMAAAPGVGVLLAMGSVLLLIALVH